MEENFTCKSCNSPVSENAKFCPECGEKIVATEKPVTIQEQTDTNEINKPKELTERIGELIGYSIVALIVIIISLIFWYISIPIIIAGIWFKSNFKYKKFAVTSLFVFFILLVIGYFVPNVEIKTETELRKISFKTIEKNDNKLLEGEYKIQSVGTYGEKKITYKIKYINGKIESRQKIKESISKKPIDEVKIIGTLPKKVKIKEAEGYYLTALSQIKGGNYELALVNLDKAIDTFPGTYQYAMDKKDQVNKAIEAAKAKQAAYEASMRLKREENTFKNSCKSIAYKVLERDADALIGSKVYLRGEVFNIEVSESKSVAQVNVTNKGYGIWTDQVFIEYPGKLNVFKDDVIKLWGTVAGQYSYESVAGYNMTVPSVEVKYYSK